MKTLFLLLFLFGGCVSELKPKERYRSFFKDFFSVSSVEKLRKHFVVGFELDKIKLPKDYRLSGIKFVSSKQASDDGLYYITADLSLTNGGDKIEVRKIISLKKEGSDWKIASFENIKTYLEIKKEIDILKTN